MWKVDIGSDDFITGSAFVKLGNVASAIGKVLLANGSPNKFQAERDAWPFIHTGIVAGELHPLAPETLDVLSIDDYGNGVVGFDELVEWGRWCHRFDFVKYVPLSTLLADYWGKPLSKLPKEAQARGGNFTTLWDMLNLEQRNELVSQIDYREDPKNAGQRHIDWHDASMDARRWWDMQNVTPNEAAMVLCRLNPLKGEDPERIYVDGDEASPHRYRLLLRVFEGVASTSPKHRTLMEWRTIAQLHNLRYHSWIDEYALAMSEAEPQNTSTMKVEAAPNAGLVPVQRQQDNAILKWLRDHKHDPKKLQRGEKGKSDVKKDCRVGVSFSSPSVFNTAWDRLRANGEIQDAK